MRNEQEAEEEDNNKYDKSDWEASVTGVVDDETTNNSSDNDSSESESPRDDYVPF